MCDADLRLRIGEIVNRNLVCVRPDTSVDALRAVFFDHDVDSVPVVDESGRPLGIVSQTDLAPPGKSAPRLVKTVEEIMTRSRHTLPEGSSLAHAFALMAMLRLDCVAVVSSEGVVVGLFAALDALPWLGEEWADVLREAQAKSA